MTLRKTEIGTSGFVGIVLAEGQRRIDSEFQNGTSRKAIAREVN